MGCSIIYMYLITAEPIRRNDVPSKAVKIRNTMNDARLGPSAVPTLLARKPTAVTIVILDRTEVISNDIHDVSELVDV